MKRKKYIANGYVELSIIVPIGGANVRVEMTGGQQSSANGMIPASFTTTSTALQNAIEKSPRFRKGFITIDEEQDIPERIIIAKTEDKEPSEDANRYSDVTNTQMAKEVLMERYGVGLAELQNKEAVKAKAKELEVKFPNWR